MQLFARILWIVGGSGSAIRRCVPQSIEWEAARILFFGIRPQGDFNSQSCLLFDLRFDLASVSAIRECHLQVPEIPSRLREQWKGSVAVLNGSTCHLDSKEQSQGIHNKMAFAPLDLLSSVKAAGFHAFLGAFRALAIQDANAW